MPAVSSAPALTLGAYALTPGPTLRDGQAEQEFYDGLARMDISAIELPLLAEGAPSLDPEWITTHIRPEWDLMITCIPRTMMRLGASPSYGLSSTDPDARAHALADLGQVRDLALRLADAAGRPRVTAVEIHSAPGPRHGSLDAFRTSLDELLGWDFTGAGLVVEHCDALVSGQDAVKGFWTVDDEIAAILDVRGADVSREEGASGTGVSGLGTGINWGRSAIEGRSATTPAAHIEAAAEAGLLRSIIFSGATDAVTAWGPAWDDTHIAPRGADPALAASASSLLGLPEMVAALASAGRSALAHVGAKVTTQPADADVTTRLAVAQASLDLVRAALSSLDT